VGRVAAVAIVPAVDALEVQLDRDRVVVFDGDVLELFGGAGRRFHVKLLTVTVSDPDKKGRRQVTLEQSQSQTQLLLDDETFAPLQPVLDALRSAGVSVSG